MSPPPKVRLKPGPEVLDAARRVLASHGYRGLTLERIAQEANVSRVTLHRHGISRDQIVNALVARSIDGCRDAMWPALATEGVGADRLRVGLGIIIDRTEAELDLLLAVRAQSDSSYHEHDDGAAPRQQEVVDPIELLVRGGVADGSLRQTDPKETALLLTNWVGWTYVHLRTAHRWDAAQAKSLVLRRVLEALMP